MPTVRVIIFVIKKNLKSIFVAPAIMHIISSGKNGRSIITKNAHRPLLTSAFTPSTLSPPTTHLTTFVPSVFPKKYANKLPHKIASKLRKNAVIGPNKITPTIVVTLAGSGMNVTCKNCSRANTKYAKNPAERIMLLSSCTFVNLPIIPVFIKKKYDSKITRQQMAKRTINFKIGRKKSLASSILYVYDLARDFILFFKQTS